jgi:hypothetical protein
VLQKGVDLSLFQRFLLNLLVVSVHKLLIKAFFHLRCNRLLRFVGLAIDGARQRSIPGVLISLFHRRSSVVDKVLQGAKPLGGLSFFDRFLLHEHSAENAMSITHERSLDARTNPSLDLEIVVL